MAKYIVELESGTHIFVLGPEGIVHIGEPDVVYETVDGMQIGDAVINAKPYTEPDLERVRLEAEQLGMVLAWDAARKIIHMPEGDLLNIFTECYSAVCTALQVILKYDASECIEKIQAYEQGKEEQIQVGDEVEMKCGVSPAIYIQGTNGSDEIYLLFNDGSCGIHCRDEIGCKTGRHFPEIAAVLKKMRGEQDG